MTFASTPEDRYFEDYLPGAVHEFGAARIDEVDIIEFARRYDPQPFHIDPEAAKGSAFGGLIASGWHTVSVSMRLLVDHYVSHVASLGSPGVDEVRWHRPVRPGDTLSVRTTVLEAKLSRSKPGQGSTRSYVEVLNQHRQVVMTWIGIGLYRCRTRTDAG